MALFDLPLEILLLTGNRFENIPREIRNLSSTLTELVMMTDWPIYFHKFRIWATIS